MHGSLGLPQLPLSGLDADAARAVLDRAGGSLSPEVVEWLIGTTQGNPLALLELAAGLTDEQRAGIEPILGPLPISSHIEHAFLERVRRLPSDDAGAAARRGHRRKRRPDDHPGRRGTAGDRGRGPRRRRTRAARPRSRLADRAAPPAGALGDLSGRAAVPAPARSMVPLRPCWSGRAGPIAGRGTAPPRASSPIRPWSTSSNRPRGRAHARGGFDAASLALERAAALAADEPRRAGLLTAAAENAWLPGQALTRPRAADARPRAERRARRSAPTAPGCLA